MDRPIDWLYDVAQVPLTSSGATIASVAERYVEPDRQGTRFSAEDASLTASSPSPWLDSLVVSAYVGAFSALVFLAQSAKDAYRKSEGEDVSSEGENLSWFRKKLEIVGGWEIFAYRAVQVVAVLALFAISLAQLVSTFTKNEETTSAHGLDFAHVLPIILCALYVSCLPHTPCYSCPLVQVAQSVMCLSPTLRQA